MRSVTLAGIGSVLALGLPAYAGANDWQKFYKAVGPGVAPSAWQGEPEPIPLTSDLQAMQDQMFENGYVLIGYSDFNSGNAKTGDALKWAKQLHARYVALGTSLKSSRTMDIPITTPTTTTSVTSGNVYGSAGSANYNGTTTTYGTQTNHIPITVNRFEKVAVFFAPAPETGFGILPRVLNPSEVTRFETQRGFVVRAIRRGSPAYRANLLPGDVILQLNGQPFEAQEIPAAVAARKAVTFTISRAGTMRTIMITDIPTSQ